MNSWFLEAIKEKNIKMNETNDIKNVPTCCMMHPLPVDYVSEFFKYINDSKRKEYISKMVDDFYENFSKFDGDIVL